MIKMVGVALIAVVLFSVLKKYSPEYGVISEIAFIVFVCVYAFPYVKEIIDFFYKYTRSVGFSNDYMDTIVKVVGIAVVTQFTADICRDSGQIALAQQVEYSGKIIMAVICIPIATAILEVAVKIVEIE